MPKLTFTMLALLLCGCSNMGEWRELTINGSSDLVFEESLVRLNDELSYKRRQMLSLALADIVQTESSRSAAGASAETTFSEADFRIQLDGLTYDGVIALADRTGPPIARLYYLPLQRQALTDDNRRLSPQNTGLFCCSPPNVPPAFAAGNQ